MKERAVAERYARALYLALQENKAGSRETILDNFLELVNNGKRMDLLPLILESFEQVFRESQGILKAMVKSASPLGSSEREEIARDLSRWSGKKVSLEVSVAPELLGGVVLQVGDRVLDGSLKTQLENMKEWL